LVASVVWQENSEFARASSVTLTLPIGLKRYRGHS
jgi:hypothetical protein